MKKIGIIGGLGPESTNNYYKGIIKAFENSYNETGYPEIFIDSLNLREFVLYEEKDEWDKITNLLVKSADNLKKAGASFGAIASNTPHYVFNKVQANTKLPLISIVKSARQYAKTNDFEKLGLLGTKFTMKAHFYQDAFLKEGIKLYTPSEEEINYIHKKLFSEIEFGIIKQTTKNEFIRIIEHMKNKYKIEGIILGCTELPLIVKNEDISIPLLDTAQLHIKSIVKYCKE